MRPCSFTMIDLGMEEGFFFFFFKMETLINIRIKRPNKTVSQLDGRLFKFKVPE